MIDYPQLALAFLVLIAIIYATTRRWERARFKPCVVYFEEGNFTELVLEDTGTVWAYVEKPVVVAGYSFDGRLIALRVYGDIRTRPVCEKAPA